MDRDRFDALARSLGRAATRRGALAALLAGVVAPLLPDSPTGLAKRGRGKRGGDGPGKANGKDRGGRGDRGHDSAKNRGRGKDHGPSKKRRKQKTKSKNRKPQPSPAEQAVKAEAACYGGSNCTPGPGKNLGKCDFSGSSILKGKNLKGANLGGATVARGDASGANLQGANLGGTCLVDANLTGALIDSSTNFSTAVLCRTQLPVGSRLNPDRDCHRGAPCCATCDAQHPCPAPGQICCKGKCVSGVCCAAEDCADNTCKTKTCAANRQCTYTNQRNGRPGTDCFTQCCNGDCCRGDERCINGACRRCDARSCAGGCCDAGGDCVAPPTNAACGAGGATCAPCAGTTPFCHPATGRCVQCLAANDCPTPTNPCRDRVCNPNGTCGTVEKANNATCGTANGAGVCCGGVCKVDDLANCTACGVPCTAGICKVATCNDKVCGQNNAENTTLCSTQNGTGVCCGGDCKVDDPAHCTACGTPCATPTNPCKVATCNDGVCGEANKGENAACSTAAGAGVCCGGVCKVDDPANCTACGVRCTAESCKVATCNDKICGTTNAQNDTACSTQNGAGVCCGGECKVDDPANCRACGAPCSTPTNVCKVAACNDGVCGEANTPNNTACGAGLVCVNGQCVCNATSCPHGCCSNGPGAEGACEAGTAHGACGAGGMPCVACVPPQTCGGGGTAKTCGCTPNCTGKVCGPNGCNNGTCGACPSGSDCNAQGRCICTATGQEPCNGVCCAAGTTCANNRCICTAASCPDGCCSDGAGNEGACRTPSNSQQCGLNGAACEVCDGQEQCSNGMCVCRPKTCADFPNQCGQFSDGCSQTLTCPCAAGCCQIGADGATGACQTSTPAHCGPAGGTCTPCPPGQNCLNGACTSVTCSGACTSNSNCPGLTDCVCNVGQGVCCTRNCAGKICGSDGCGGFCGFCRGFSVCSGDGVGCIETSTGCEGYCV